MARTTNSISTHNILSGTLNENNVISGLVNTAFNPAYALVTQAGAQIVLFINSTDYKMYAQLKDKSGNLIYTSNIIDLPLESMVVDGRYDSNTKKLVLVLDNGNEIEVPLGALINGLVNEEDLAETLSHYYTEEEIDSLLSGYWTKVDFTQEDIENWNNKQEYLNQGDGIVISADTILGGNTSQFSTTGKQLLDITTIINTTNNGITATIDSTTGKVLLNGTANANSLLTFKIKELEVNTIVSLSANNPVANSSVSIRLYNLDTGTITPNVDLNSINKVENGRTLASNFDCFQIRTASDTTLTNFELKPQLELGSTATNWEKYTGNSPSPSPDYPQDIEVVSGDNTIKVEGKNLFDISLTPTENSLSQAGITATINNDGTITCNGTKSANYKYIRYDITLPAGTYYFSGCISGGSSTTYSSIVQTGDATSTQVHDTGNGATFTLTETTTVRYFPVRVASGSVTFNNAIFKPMIAKVPVTYNDFEKYQSQEYSVNLGSLELCKINDYKDKIKRSSGKNLLNLPNGTYTDKGITATVDNGKVVLNGTASENSLIYIDTNISVEAKAYTWSANNSVANSNVILRFDTDKMVGGLNATNKTITSTFETQSTLEKFCIRTTSGTTLSNFVLYPQLEQGASATTYEPYGKVWCKYKEIGKIVLDGTQGISTTGQTNLYFIYKDILNISYLRGGFSDNFKYNDSSSIIDNTSASNTMSNNEIALRLGTDASRDRLYIKTDIVSSREDLKNWFGTHNTEVYYALANPTNEPITDTTLINQLNALSAGLSNKWIKNINQINAELPFELEYDNTNLVISADSNFVRNTDYASTSIGGVIKTGQYGVATNSSGYIYSPTYNTTQYENANNSTFISKGTLENVIIGKQLESQTNKVTLINKNSTNTQYPSAKCLYDNINPLQEEVFGDETVSDIGESVTLDNTAETPLKIELSGNTSQFSTTGKNLLNNVLTNGTTNGITFTKNSDGSVTVNGTATADTYKPINTFSFESGTSYKMTGCPSGGTSSTYFLTLNSSPYSTDFGNGVTISTASGNIQVSIGIKSGATVNNLKFYPMIRLSSVTDDTYEPYTGSNPSPSPDYPQDIEVVSGDNTIKVEGKNLCNGINQNVYLNNAASQWGIASNNSGLYIQVSGGNYTISTTKTQERYRVACSDNEPSTVAQTSYRGQNKDNTSNSITIDTTGYTYLIVNATDLSAIQIEKGSQATTYEPYQSQEYSVNLGSLELCKIGDYKDKIKRSSGKNLFITEWEQGEINSSGNNAESSTTIRTKDYISVTPNQHYAMNRSITGGYINVRGYNANKEFIGAGSTVITLIQGQSSGTSAGNPMQNNDTQCVIAPKDNVYYLRFNDLSNNLSTKYMMTKGDTQETYEPYGKVWCKYKEIGKIILNGSETITQTDNTSYSATILRFNISVSNKKINTSDSNVDNILCNDFTARKLNYDARTQESISGHRYDQLLIVFIDSSRLSSANVEGFKTWLSNNNVEVYYVLANPTNEPITDTTLINQLDLLEKAMSYKGQTNISSIANNKNPILDVSAIKDNLNGKVTWLNAEVNQLNITIGNIDNLLINLDSGNGVS